MNLQRIVEEHHHVLSAFRPRRPVEIGRRCTLPVDEEVRSGYECATLAHHQLGYVGYFVRRAGASRWAFGKHLS